MPVITAASSKQPQANTTTAAPSIDVSNAFPTARIKTILQKEDGIGALPKKTVDMIGASSALFLQKLLQAAETAATQTAQDGTLDPNNTRTATLASGNVDPDRPVVVTAADVKRALETNESWHFFSPSLEEELPAGGQESSTTSHLLPQKRPAKRAGAGHATNLATSKKKRPKKESTETLDEQAAVEQALKLAAPESLTLTINQEIQADEEDYDD
jgi:hypothetical protein